MTRATEQDRGRLTVRGSAYIRAVLLVCGTRPQPIQWPPSPPGASAPGSPPSTRTPPLARPGASLPS
eukprot:2635107-Rhodomonas_salina.1